MADYDGLLDIISTCHEAAAGRSGWDSALQQVAVFFGSTAATLEVYDRRDFSYRFFRGHGLPDSSVEDYAAYYCTLNPRIPHGLGSGQDEVVFDYQHIDDDNIDRNEFYVDFLQPMDLRYHLAANLRNDADEFAGFSIQNSKRQGHASERDIACMKTLAPHVRQALDVHRRLYLAETWQNSLRESAEWLEIGSVFLDRAGRIVHANDYARALFRQNDGLTCKTDRLAAGLPTTQRALDRKIGATLTSVTELDAIDAGDVLVQRPSGNLPYVVAVRPLAKNLTSWGHPAVAVVFIADPLRHGEIDPGQLAATFGLTAAETELAMALARGSTLKACAEAKQVSINTVRYQLAQITQKLGVSRQSDVVRMLMRLESRTAQDRMDS